MAQAVSSQRQLPRSAPSDLTCTHLAVLDFDHGKLATNPSPLDPGSDGEGQRLPTIIPRLHLIKLLGEMLELKRNKVNEI